MTVCMALVGVTFLNLAQPRLATDHTNAEVAKLRGNWVIVAWDPSDPAFKVFEKDVKGGRVEFTQDHIQLKGVNGTKKFRYKLNANMPSKEMDWISEKGEPIPGIYRLEGDTLKICIADYPGKQRPTEFKAKGPKNGQGLIILKRAKP